MVDAGTAVRLGDGAAQEAERGHLADDLDRIAFIAVVVADVGRNLLLRELPDERLVAPLLFGQAEVHATSGSVRVTRERERPEAAGQLAGALELADAPAEIPGASRHPGAEVRRGEGDELLPERGLGVRAIELPARLVHSPDEDPPVGEAHLHAGGPRVRA